jgi:hypothetical protein
MIQELAFESRTNQKSPVWTLKFSLDGKYLAAAGQASFINVYLLVTEKYAGEIEEGKGIVL